MKSAMWAEFLLTKRLVARQFMVGLACALMLIVFTGMPLTAVPPMLGWLIAVTLPISAVALDERNGWESCRAVLPMSRSQVMLGRCAFTILVTFAATCLGVAIAFVLSLAAPLLAGSVGLASDAMSSFPWI